MATMKPYRRAVAVTGTYTDRNGDEKKRYVNVGTLFQYDDGGLALKLDSIPVGEGWNGFLSFFEIEDRREGGGRDEPRREARGRDDRGGRRGERGGYGNARSSSPKESFPADYDDEIPF